MPRARPWTAAAWVFVLAAGWAWPSAGELAPGVRLVAAAGTCLALGLACLAGGLPRLIAVAAAAAGLALARTPAPAVEQQDAGRPVRVHGVLLSWHADGADGGWGRLEVQGWEGARARARPVELGVRGRCMPPSAPSPGRRIVVEGWLERDRGRLHLDRASLRALPDTELRPIARLRQAAHERLHRALEAPHSGLAVALLLGEWGELDDALEERYRRLGLFHVLAVSGLHLWLWDLLLRWVTRGRFARARWTALTLLAALAGFGPAVVRAWLALALRAWTERRGRRIEAARLWALALFLEVAFLAPERQGLGFLLSYSATGALLTLPRAPHMPAWRRALSVSLAGFLGSLPWLAAAQGTCEPWSVPATPIFGLLLPPRIVLCALSWMPAGGVVAQPALEALERIDAALAAPFLRLPGTPLSCTDWPLATALVAAAAGLLALRAFTEGRRPWGCLWLATAAVAALPRASHEPGLLLLPLGHGLGVVIAGEQRSLILDLGSRTRSPRDAVDRVLMPALRRRGWPAPDRSLLTHEDADHAGGLRVLEARGGVRRIGVAPGGAHPLPGLEPFFARAHGTRAAVAGVRNAAGPVLELRLPRATRQAERVVVLGDQFGYALRDLATRLEPGPIAVLVLPHHGLTTDGLGELLDHLRPGEAWAATDRPAAELPAAPLCARRGIPLRTSGREGLSWP